MGTEMRIGIAVGVLIVAATSVYFIYGSDRSSGDLLITPDAEVADAKDASKAAETPRPATTADARRRRAATSASPKPMNANRATRANASGDDNAPRGTTVARRTTHRGTTPPLTTTDRPAKPGGAARPDLNSAVAALANRRGGAPRGSNPATARNTVLAERGDATSPADEGDEPIKGDWISTKRDPAIKPVPVAQGKSSSSTAPVRNPSVQSPSGAPEFNTTSAIVKAAERSGSAGTRPVVLGSKTPDANRPVVLPRVEATWPRRHTIASGDTLSDISMKYYDTSRKVDLILAANPDVDGPRALQIGRELLIPDPALPIAKPSRGIVRTASARDGDKIVVRRASSAPAARTYTVKKGDTFYSIARDLYGSPARWKELLERNKSLVKNKASNLRPGMVLKVRVR